MNRREFDNLKSRTILRPFLLATLALLTLSGALSYWLAGQSPYDPSPVWPVVVPGLGAVALAGLVLRPRLRILAIDRDKHGEPTWLEYGTFYGIFLGTVLLVGYFLSCFMADFRGQLVTLDTIAGLPRQPLARFYALRHPYVGLTRAEVQVQLVAASKSHARQLDSYVCYPLLAAPGDSASGLPVAWLARSYRRPCPTGDPYDIQQQAEQLWHRRFAQSAGGTADSLQHFAYLQLVTPSGDEAGYYRALSRLAAYGLTGELPVVLKPVEADRVGWPWPAFFGVLAGCAAGIGLFNGVLVGRPPRPADE